MSKQSFISKVVAQAGVTIVQVRHPAVKGRFGFTRLVDGVLERSAKTYSTPEAAEAAAHAHYKLRAA